MRSILFLALIGVAAVSAGRVNPELASLLEKKQSVNIFVDFVGGTQQVLNGFESRVFKTRTDRLSTLKSSLESNAARSQHKVQTMLKDSSVEFKSFWISNQIFIKGADKKTVQALAAFPEVAEIYEEIVVEKMQPVSRGPTGEGKSQNNEWGITKIQAPEAWQITNGTGVVVANIDGGVHGSHEALRDRFRKDHGWRDPADRSEDPWDEDDGHGTHTMGSITGSHGIGVAPGANWIACKGCGLVSCPQSDLTECGEFMVCPTNTDGSDADCSKSPNLVSNSWGGGRGSNWYETVTEAWIAGGIVPVFSQGNSGPSCGTANSPGDYRRVIGVGATDSNDEIAYFSSVGPAADGRIKPEISGPGVDIRSSMPGSSNAVYGTMSGTSMSCPHISGVTALILSVNPNLNFGQVRTILTEAVDTDIGSTGAECGGISDRVFPNHHFGFGRVNALKAVRTAQATLKQ